MELIVALLLAAVAVWLVRIALIDQSATSGDTVEEAGMPRNSKATSGESFPVPIVGERSYQSAIAACGEGEAVKIYHEPDNPYDGDALVVVCHGDTIGYIGRDSWLREAVLDEEQGCAAHIKRLTTGTNGITGVVLNVSLGGDPIRERDYQGG